MDHALLLSGLGVLNERGEVIDGKIEVLEQEKRWIFTPERTFSPGSYQIRISTDLEDLAGNNLQRPFDKDLRMPAKSQPDSPFIELPFQI